MIKYISTRGGVEPVGFDEAVLAGFAADGGLFVPESIPGISHESLEKWVGLSYVDLAAEVLSLFIDPGIIPEQDLKQLINTSFARFEHPDVMPLKDLDRDGTCFIMEMFHGPTLSFKDIAMGFLVNTMDYLLEKKNQHLNLILATTGDTGPAAAHASCGKPTIDCWPLYPRGMITDEQARQMTTLAAANVHTVGVDNCPDGGDDLDLVVARLFADPDLKEILNLSSVNSINWCRVMVQAVHYIYGYLKVCKTVGEPIGFSVPSGAFGNLFGGYLAREMGLPIQTFVCANNLNSTLHTAFSTGIFKKQDLCRTVSSAIDIVVPYNFWRLVYFAAGCDSEKLSGWMDRFKQTGEIRLDTDTFSAVRKGYESCSISDALTLSTIRETWKNQGYLLDPHGAVAVAAARGLVRPSKETMKMVCLATAHPAKFPGIIEQALGAGADLPRNALHPELTRARKRAQNQRICSREDLESLLISAIKKRNYNRR